MNILQAIMPPWVRWTVLILAFGFTAMTFQMRGERIAGQRHIDYVTKQATQTVRIARAQSKVVVQAEIEYRDRIKKIYVKGDVIERKVPVYVTNADNDRCTISAGFVRVYDAAWSGEPTGPAADSDRGPAGVSLADVAETDVHNATSCRAWREQALGWRAFYRKLKEATDDMQTSGHPTP
jgi:hypothetical protein